MNVKRLASGDYLWLGLVLLFALGIAFLLPVTPQDFWWYLRLGRDTLSSGAIPKVDAFSYSQAGTPVVYHSWAAAVLFWLVYKLGGLPLSVLLRGLLVGSTYTLTWLTARRAGAGRLGASLVLLAAVLASSNNWSLRPQLFAYPLFALAVWILYRWQAGRDRTLWALPVLSLLWVNLHGSFVILVLLVGAAVVFGEGNRGRLLIAFSGVLAATLLNPRIFGAWTYVFNSVTVASSQLFSAEWRPPANTGWQMNIFFVWLLAFPLLAALARRRLSRLEWTWYLGFGLLALWGLRYVVWFVLLLAVFTSLLLADWEHTYLGRPRPGPPALNLGLALVFVLLPLAFLPGLRQRWWKQAPPDTEATPLAATEWLAAHPGLPGPLWSEIGFSSYLEFALPARPTWIDTRFEVFPVAQWQAYRAINAAAWDWQARLDGSGANLLMVSVDGQPELIRALDVSGAWCLRYRDAVAAIYTRGACAAP